MLLRTCRASSKKGDNTPAPVEEWITMIRECIEVQRLGVNHALILEWIAMFEEHPDPAACCGVDYKAIYLYISALLEVFHSLGAIFVVTIYLVFLSPKRVIFRNNWTPQARLNCT